MINPPNPDIAANTLKIATGIMTLAKIFIIMGIANFKTTNVISHTILNTVAISEKTIFKC